jgi:hypothetical protein
MMRLSKAYRRWNLLVDDASELSVNALMLELGHNDDRDLLLSICNAAGLVVAERFDTGDLICVLHTRCRSSAESRKADTVDLDNPFLSAANRVPIISSLSGTRHVLSISTRLGLKLVATIRSTFPKVLVHTAFLFRGCSAQPSALLLFSRRL